MDASRLQTDFYSSRRKGQSLSIDWLTGFSVFMFTIVAGIVFLSGFQPGLSNSEELEVAASELVDAMEEGSSIKTVRASVLAGSDIGMVPLESNYSFVEDSPGRMSVDRGKVARGDGGNSDWSFRAVINSSVESSISYFPEEDAGRENPVNNVNLNGDNMSTSSIEVKVTSNGMEVLEFDNGGNLLKDTLSISGSPGTVKKNVSAESFNGVLKVFSDTNEFLLEKDNPVLNLTSYNESYIKGETKDVNSSGITENDVEGFTLLETSGDGLTVLGNFTQVSIVEGVGTEVDLDTTETIRLRPHSSGYSYVDRINVHKEGKPVVGARKTLEPVLLNRTGNLDESDLKNSVEGLSDFSANFGDLQVEGNSSEAENVVVRNSTVLSTNVNGTLSSLEVEVSVW